MLIVASMLVLGVPIAWSICCIRVVGRRLGNSLTRRLTVCLHSVLIHSDCLAVSICFQVRCSEDNMTPIACSTKQTDGVVDCLYSACMLYIRCWAYVCILENTSQCHEQCEGISAAPCDLRYTVVGIGLAMLHDVGQRIMQQGTHFCYCSISSILCQHIYRSIFRKLATCP